MGGDVWEVVVMIDTGCVMIEQKVHEKVQKRTYERVYEKVYERVYERVCSGKV